MNDQEMKKMSSLEKTYWWHVGKTKIVAELIRPIIGNFQNPKILDVGCGTGSLTKSLTPFGDVYGFDISETAVYFCRQQGLYNIKVGDINNLPYEDNFAEIIVCSDMLEHVDDDIHALKELYRVLKPNGRLVITVPAHKFLWSVHDEALSHRRRYTKRELNYKLKSTGFVVERDTYSVAFLFPAIFLYRTWQVFFTPYDLPKTSYVILPNFLNQFFLRTIELEAFLMRYIRIPMGVSINSVVKK